MKELLTQIDELMKEEKAKQIERWRKGIEQSITRGFEVKKRVFHLYYREHLRIGFLEIGRRLVGDGIDRIKKGSLEDKEWFIEKVESEMKNWEIDSSHTQQVICHNAKDKTQRVKMITEGKDVSEILFIEEKERKEIIKHFYDLAILHLKKEIEYEEKGVEKKVFEHLMWLHDCPYVKDFDFIEFISEKALKSFSELEDIEEIKELIRHWYQSKAQKPIIFKYKTDRIEKAMKYRYLFNACQKEEIVKEFRKAFEERFKQIKKYFGGYYSSTESELEKLKEDIYLLEQFEK